MVTLHRECVRFYRATACFIAHSACGCKVSRNVAHLCRKHERPSPVLVKPKATHKIQSVAVGCFMVLGSTGAAPGQGDGLISKTTLSGPRNLISVWAFAGKSASVVRL